MCYCVSKQLFINSSGLSSDVCSSAAGAAVLISELEQAPRRDMVLMSMG